MAKSKNELISGVQDFFSSTYDVKNGYTIPDVADIPFAKTGRELELAMLFIDIRESTKIVDGFRRITGARMYKSFLWGVSQIARNNGGELRSFNGDGVLMAFVGDTKCTNATKSALQMSWFCKKVLKPQVESYMKNNSQLQDIDFNFGIGIDVGKVLVVRGGIRGENNNDLVWVGNATNYAVKLSSIKDDGANVFISEAVFKKIADSSKYSSGENKRIMWEKKFWTKMDNMTIYTSNWTWTPN